MKAMFACGHYTRVPSRYEKRQIRRQRCGTCPNCDQLHGGYQRGGVLPAGVGPITLVDAGGMPERVLTEPEARRLRDVLRRLRSG